MPSNTSSKTEVLIAKKTTHTRWQTKLAKSPRKPTRFPPSLPTRTFNKDLKPILPLLLPSDQFPLPLKLTNVDSNHTNLVSSPEFAELNSTTVSLLLDTVKDTGLSRTLGEPPGVWKVTSKWPEDKTNAVSPTLPHTQSPDPSHHQDHHLLHLHHPLHPHPEDTTPTQTQDHVPMVMKPSKSLASQDLSAPHLAVSSRNAQKISQTVPLPSQNASSKPPDPKSQPNAP